MENTPSRNYEGIFILHQVFSEYVHLHGCFRLIIPDLFTQLQEPVMVIQVLIKCVINDHLCLEALSNHISSLLQGTSSLNLLEHQVHFEKKHIIHDRSH